MIKLFKTVWNWLDDRLGISVLLSPMKHIAPQDSKWWYVFGSATLVAFIVQVASGVALAFSANCTHLGCPVRWLEGADLFMCPCHGGVYYSDGNVAAGPPPLPLFRYDVRVANGEVQMKQAIVPISTAL